MVYSQSLFNGFGSSANYGIKWVLFGFGLSPSFIFFYFIFVEVEGRWLGHCERETVRGPIAVPRKLCHTIWYNKVDATYSVGVMHGGV